MHLKRFLLILLLCSLSLQVQAATVTDNSGDLIGTWDIIDSNNNVIDSIAIVIAIAKTGTARFSFRQTSLDSTEDSSLQGYLFDDTVVFNLTGIGSSQTYIAKIDFTLGGGAGVELRNPLADCTLVGEDKTLVKVKYVDRLAIDSARCDGSLLNDAVVSNIKFVKRGVSASSIPTASAPTQDILDKETSTDQRLSGAWNISGGRRIIIKDVVASSFGYKFSYRLINPATPLASLNQSDFLTGLRQGYLINNYMIINSSRFNKVDELYLLKLTKLNGSGRRITFVNGDCFPLKHPISSNLVCTPNESSSVVDTVSSRQEGINTAKIETNVTISF